MASASNGEGTQTLLQVLVESQKDQAEALAHQWEDQARRDEAQACRDQAQAICDEQQVRDQEQIQVQLLALLQQQA